MAFNYLGTALSDLMGSGTATPGSGLTSGLPGVDRWDGGDGGDTFVYQLNAMGGNDRFSGGLGKDIVEFRLTAAEFASFGSSLIAFRAAVTAKAASFGGELPLGVANASPLVFSPSKSLLVLEAEDVRIYSDNVLVAGPPPTSTVGKVIEAGVNAKYVDDGGIPEISGFMPYFDQAGKPIPLTSTWSVSLADPADIYAGKLPTGMTIDKTTGKWTYKLDNDDVNTQDLQNTDTKTLKFSIAATDGTSSAFNTVTITVEGKNDKQVGVFTGPDFTVSERGGVNNGTAGPDGDGETGNLQLTNVDNNPAATFKGSFEDTGTYAVAGKYGDLLIVRNAVPGQADSKLGNDVTNATWTYVVRNLDPVVQALTAADKLVQDPITLPAGLFDGANQTITMFINGADDAPVISGGLQDVDVVEWGGYQDTSFKGNETAGGQFVQSDPDFPLVGPAAPAPVLGLTNKALISPILKDPTSSIGVYGDFTLTPTGKWEYVLDNTRPATKALNDDWDKTGELPKFEKLTVFSSTDPGSSYTITVKVFGRDDLTQSIPNKFTGFGGTVDEVSGPDTKASGDLDRIDTDLTHGDFSGFGGPVASVPGDPLTVIGGNPLDPTAKQIWIGKYGDFELDGNTGLWSYERKSGPGYLDSGLLKSTEFATDVMLVKSNDNGAQGDATVQIIGADDTPTFKGSNAGSVIEGGGARIPVPNLINPIPTANGKYETFDEDLNQTGWKTVPAAAKAGTYGDFVFTEATGVWSYAVNNKLFATEELTNGQVVTETLNLETLDGTKASIVITVTGANDHAEISGSKAGAVKEAGGVANGDVFTPTTSGDLDVADVDGKGGANESRFKPVTADNSNYAVLTDTVGVYGNFTFDPNNGKWSYDLNNNDLIRFVGLTNVGLQQATALQALADGVTVTDTMVVFSEDNSASETITVTITGSYDASNITNTADTNGSVVRAEGSTRDSAGVASKAAADYLAGGNLNATVDDYVPQTTTQLKGVFGQFTLNDLTGAWTYTLDNEDLDTRALLSTLDKGGKLIPSAQDFLTVTNLATIPEVYTIAVDVYGAYTVVDYKGIPLDPTTPVFDAYPNVGGARDPGATATVFGIGDQGTITFDVRSGDSDEPVGTLKLYGDDPLITAALPFPWGTVPVNDGSMTTVSAPTSPASNGVVNEILYVWDGDKHGGVAIAPVNASLNLEVSIAQGTVGSDFITMVGKGGLGMGYTGNDNITGTAFNDFIDGGDDNDILSGLAGNDTILGGTGADDLDGGAGNDRLVGGTGRDTLEGGADNNVYVFGSGPFDSVLEDDTVIGYSTAADQIEISRSLLVNLTDNEIDVTKVWYNEKSFADINANNYDLNDRFILDTTNGGLYYDPDGNGALTRALVADFDVLTLGGAGLVGGSEFNIVTP